MSRKSKGCDAERELIHLFWQTNEWTACRVAGSGSIRYPVPDIIASNQTRKLAIECKATKAHSQYIDKQEIDDLKQFATLTNAEPVIAIRFTNTPWYFFNPAALDQTDKHFVITRPQLTERGKLFKDLVKQNTP